MTGNAKTARLSFSTKLTDYFRSGKCILAVGNGDTAPMEYLKEKDAAICASNSEEIINAIKLLTENGEVIPEYAQKAYNCGKENHDKKEIQKRLFEKINL